MDDCFAIRSSRKQRNRCFEEIAGHDLQRVIEAQQSLGSDATPLERDLLRLQLATEVPRLAASICGLAETEEGLRLCSRMVDRPHLHVTDGDWALRDKASDGSERKERKERKERDGQGAGKGSNRQ